MKLYSQFFSVLALVFLLTGCGKDDNSVDSASKSPLKFNFPNPPPEVKTEKDVAIGSLKAFNLKVSSSNPIEIAVYSQSGCEKTHRIGNEKIDNSNSDIPIDLGDPADGTYKFHYKIVSAESAAGSCINSGFTYKLDTSINILELAFATGFASPSNNRQPSFTIQGEIEEGASVTLHDEGDGADCSGDEIPSTVSGNAITASLPEAHHTYKFRVKHTDSLGNVSCSTNALVYELDTTPPAALTLSLPSGVNSPNNDTTPSLVIGGVIETGATITLHNGSDCSSVGVTHTRTNNNNITVSTLAEGTYNFRIKHTDSVGNFSCSTNALVYKLDTIAAVLTPSLPVGATSPSNDTTPSLVIGGTIEDGATVTLHDGSNCSGNAISYTGTNTITVSTALTTNKVYNFRIKHTDSLGNVSCSTNALAYELDTEIVALTLAFYNNTESPSNNASPRFKIVGGTIEDDRWFGGWSPVTLHDGSDCSGAEINVGIFSFSWDYGRFSDQVIYPVALTTNKTYNFRIKHIDLAGNSICSANALDYVLDTTPPAALTLSFASGLTSPGNDTTPSLVIGGVIESGATVTLHDGSGCHRSAIPYTGTNNITVSTALPTNKAYRFRLKHTDSLGNTNCSANALDYVLGTPVASTKFEHSKISVGGFHTCVRLSSNGKIKCWGGNSSRQLGLGDENHRGDNASEMGDNLPFVDVGTYDHDDNSNTAEIDFTVKQISLGENHTCAILNNDKIKCWGDNNRFQLGLGLSSRGSDKRGDASILPFVYLGGFTAKQVALGLNHTCAILNNDKIKCWGYNTYGQLGLGNTNIRASRSQLGDNLPFVDLGTYDHDNDTDTDKIALTAKQIALGETRTCALLSNDKIKCWGGRWAVADEMGDSLPFVSLGTEFTVKQIVLGGDEHTCALFSNDKIKCWGDNSTGQLGLGYKVDRSDASYVSFVNLGTYDHDNNTNTDKITLTVKQIALGKGHTCALLSNDKIKCWGGNSDGQLGYGDTNNRGDDANEMGDNLPFVDLGADLTAKQIALGDYYTCALLSNDKVKCWGDNSNGQLGLGDKIDRGDGANEMGDNLPFVDLGAE